MGVVHEPDFPVPVGAEAQVTTREAAEAVDRYGVTIVLATGRTAEMLSTGQMHAARSASRDDRRQIMDVVRQIRDEGSSDE